MSRTETIEIVIDQNLGQSIFGKDDVEVEVVFSWDEGEAPSFHCDGSAPHPEVESVVIIEDDKDITDLLDTNEALFRDITDSIFEHEAQKPVFNPRWDY